MRNLLLRLLPLLAILAFIPPAFGDGMAVYEMQPPTFRSQDANKVLQAVRTGAPGTLSPIRQMQVKPIGPNPAAPMQNVTVYGTDPNKARALFNEARSRLEIYPELGALQGTAPNADSVRTIARQFASQNLGMAQEIQDWSADTVVTTATAESTRGSQPRDVARTVRFVRMLDGLPVVGPNSVLSVSVGPQNQVVGAVRSFLPVLRSASTPPQVKNRGVLDQELNAKIGRLAGKMPGMRLALRNSRMVYYEQGGKYIQPALMGTVTVNGPQGVLGAIAVVVPALPQPPEPIPDNGVIEQLPANSPAPRPVPRESDKLPNIIAHKDNIDPRAVLEPWVTEAPQKEVKYGVYVVRNDYPDWTVSANLFRNGVKQGNAAARAGNSSVKPVQEYQYAWNYIWRWRGADGIEDHSDQNMRQVDLAVIMGHGANFRITTKGNGEDLIHLDGIPGYGANSPLGGRTDYIVWKSCSVIPAPRDNPNCWAPWAGIFKGMRGNYGFRTISWVNDDIMDDFGYAIGSGVPILTAWFNAANSCKWDHYDGGNYASAIMPKDMEGQTIYDNSAISSSTDLVIWYQY